MNTSFIKQKSKIGSPQVSNWNPPDWESTVITITPCSTESMMESLKLLYAHLQSLGTILETLHFPYTVQVLSKSIPNVHNSIKPQQKLTSICLIIYKHSTHTKLHQPAHYCLGLRRRNSNNKKQNSSARQNRLTLRTNSRVISHKSWMARCFLAFPDFGRKNKPNASNQYRTVE